MTGWHSIFLLSFLSDMRFPLRMINGLQNNLSRRRKFFYEKNVFKTQLLLHKKYGWGNDFLLHRKWTFSINFGFSAVTYYIIHFLLTDGFCWFCLFITFAFFYTKNKTNKRLRRERTCTC